MNRWERYGLLALLVQKMYKHNLTLGKTALQKLIYLTKVLCNIGVDYDYGLYIYGPYSHELVSDFEYLTAVGVLKSEFKHYEKYGGYEIRPGDNISEATNRAKDFIARSDKELEEIIKRFGKMSARELELIATILYLNREEELGKTILPERVKSIKPHFSMQEIEKCIDEMKDYIN